MYALNTIHVPLSGFRYAVGSNVWCKTLLTCPPSFDSRLYVLGSIYLTSLTFALVAMLCVLSVIGYVLGSTPSTVKRCDSYPKNDRRFYVLGLRYLKSFVYLGHYASFITWTRLRIKLFCGLTNHEFILDRWDFILRFRSDLPNYDVCSGHVVSLVS